MLRDTSSFRLWDTFSSRDCLRWRNVYSTDLSSAKSVNTRHLLRVEEVDAQHGVEGKHHRSQHEDAASALHGPECCTHDGNTPEAFITS